MLVCIQYLLKWTIKARFSQIKLKPWRLFLYSKELFNVDIRQNLNAEVNLEKKKKEISKKSFHQKVENMKQKFTLILD